MNDEYKIAEKLKEYRVEELRRKPQNIIAAELGVSQSYISRAENSVKPSIHAQTLLIQRYVEVYGADAAFFYGLSSNQQPQKTKPLPSANIQHLLDECRENSKVLREYILVLQKRVEDLTNVNQLLDKKHNELKKILTVEYFQHASVNESPSLYAENMIEKLVKIFNQ